VRTCQEKKEERREGRKKNRTEEQEGEERKRNLFLNSSGIDPCGVSVSAILSRRPWIEKYV
jgi:hypothetical protein